MKYGLAEDAEKTNAPWPRRQSVHVPFEHIFSRMMNDTDTERDSRDLFRHRIDTLTAQLAFAETDIDYLLEKIQVLEERQHRDRQKLDEQATRFQQELEDVKRAQDPLSKTCCPNKAQGTTPASKSSSPTFSQQASDNPQDAVNATNATFAIGKFSRSTQTYVEMQDGCPAPTPVQLHASTQTTFPEPALTVRKITVPFRTADNGKHLARRSSSDSIEDAAQGQTSLSASAECCNSDGNTFVDDQNENDDEKDNNDIASPVDDAAPPINIARLQRTIRTLNVILSVPGLDDAIARRWHAKLQETEAELEFAFKESQVTATARQALRDLKAFAKGTGTRRSVADGAATLKGLEGTANCSGRTKTAEPATDIVDELAIARISNRTYSLRGDSTAESPSSDMTMNLLETT